ncbi:putative uncharacterized protein [Dorea formicigenerans CAG:28]|nr:putative uncharacterized protein [Dorea formicigenerans CAG:28]
MIVKMRFLNISGPRDDIDRVCEKYLSKYEMQIENAVTELKTTENIMPFVEVNPYRDPLAKAEQFAQLLPEDREIRADLSGSKDDMLALIRELNHDYLGLVEDRERLKLKKEELLGKENVLKPFSALKVDVHKVLQYQYMQVRFGRISLDYYRRLEKYLADSLNAIFLEAGKDKGFVYGCYIAANADIAKADNTFRALHFERIDVTDAYIGTPKEACEKLDQDMEAVQKDIDADEDKITALMKRNAAKLLGARKRLQELADNFDIRKLAARVTSEDERDEFYILCGWMSEKDVDALLAETQDDDKISIMVEDERDQYFGDPPTKLENPKVFKPFEMFIKMYGLPAHDEMDPTMFVALTYTFIFGAMFGDLGQGFCLFAIGGILYLTKKINLAGIISIAGIFSMFFGFMFGSVFGFEDIIEAHWLRPVSAMTNLPFIGQLNTVFVVAIAFGMALNILVMIFNIINSAKAHDKENMLLSTNGVAGLVFYGFLVLTVVLYMTGHKTPGNVMLVIFLGIPVLLFVFKEPLGNLVEKRHKKMEGGKVMFFVQAFFELFEAMLSYFSNTISYVRIGAFAVSHAAMMEVVLMLSGASAGSTNWIIFVIGNIIVCGLEGLVVGIQVLRLEYYEMFSRFYKGTGREFKPFHKQSE